MKQLLRLLAVTSLVACGETSTAPTEVSTGSLVNLSVGGPETLVSASFEGMGLNLSFATLTGAVSGNSGPYSYGTATVSDEDYAGTLAFMMALERGAASYNYARNFSGPCSSQWCGGGGDYNPMRGAAPETEAQGTLTFDVASSSPLQPTSMSFLDPNYYMCGQWYIELRSAMAAQTALASDAISILVSGGNVGAHMSANAAAAQTVSNEITVLAGTYFNQCVPPGASWTTSFTPREVDTKRFMSKPLVKIEVSVFVNGSAAGSFNYYAFCTSGTNEYVAGARVDCTKKTAKVELYTS